MLPLLIHVIDVTDIIPVAAPIIIGHWYDGLRFETFMAHPKHRIFLIFGLGTFREL